MVRLSTLALALAALAAPERSTSGEPPAPAPETAVDAEAKALERRIEELREKVLRARARLAALEEAVATGEVAAGARAVVVHENEMGASFVLESVAFSLDGAPVLTRVDPDGGLDRARELPVFDGRLPAGDHQLTVRLSYRGHGRAGARDVEAQRFHVESAQAFRAEPGKVTVLRVIGHEKGGASAPLSERLAVRYALEVKADPGVASGGGAGR